MTTQLEERRILVFGAGGALGSGIAAHLVGAGADVVGVDAVVPPSERRVDGVRYHAVDATSDADVGRLIEQESPLWGVANTIGGFVGQTPLADLDAAALRKQLELNLLTAAVITKHALQRMVPQGAGRVVHTAGKAAVEPRGSAFAYSVSKLGVLRLTEMAADEVRGSGVCVNCIVPIIIDTPANRAAMPNADYSSWTTTDDIAHVIAFLMSGAARTVNGAAIPV